MSWAAIRCPALQSLLAGCSPLLAPPRPSTKHLFVPSWACRTPHVAPSARTKLGPALISDRLLHELEMHNPGDVPDAT
ncbi:hypothetical protein CCUS01_17286 [Colletotrichum cuscutae]|uniref:Uncharacterized protein n=1 Tax=Colletotrichum cuscutae TaxID=1209917 RepID=A0AAI9V680_9PEZI|nr:hypothetical protein CCUS01_17286 [Colletotrichum cuscutae]